MHTNLVSSVFNLEFLIRRCSTVTLPLKRLYGFRNSKYITDRLSENCGSKKSLKFGWSGSKLCFQVIGIARNAFNSRKPFPIPFRLQQLKNIVRMLEYRAEDIQYAIAKDLRKHKNEVTIFDIEVCRFEAIYAMKHLKRWSSVEKIPFNMLAATDTGYVQQMPYGLVLVLGTWNFPVMLALQPMIGAIAAGNCVILKPSELSHNVANLLAKILPEYIDRECYHVVQGGPEETQELLRHKFDHIFYTGSASVGRIIMTAAARHLTPVTLELGGKTPCYVDDSSDVEMATKRILWGAFLSMGQVCVAVDYVLCSRKVESVFLKVAAQVLQEWYGRDPQKSGDLARIINEKHCLRLKRLLDTTKGRVVIGGSVDVEDLYIEPTIVVDLEADDSLMQSEIFGPILPIFTVNSVEEAIRFINSRPSPLSLYTFSKNDAINKKIVSQTRSGTVCVNDVMWQQNWPGLPFGGVGDSGIGNYHGKASFDTFSHQRGVLCRSFDAFSDRLGEFRYPPYTDRKLKFIQFFMRYIMYFDVPTKAIFTHLLALFLGAVIFCWLS